MTIVKKIKSLEKKRTQIIKTIFGLSPVLPGSYKKVYRKCGKSNCWCNDQKGHSLKRITWTEKGRSHSKAVKDEDIVWVIKATKNYRKFREMIKILKKIELDIYDVLDDFVNEIIKNNRDKKNGLKK